MTDCLSKAKAAFSEMVDNSEIESIHDALQRTKKYAEKTGANMFEALERRAETEIENRERALEAQQLQNLMSMQATVDNLLRIKQWQEKGVNNPLVRALLAKIGGSPVRIEGARRSTQLKMATARSKFLRSFANRLHDDGTIEVWNSKQHQVEIVDAIMKKRAGQPIDDPTFRKIADAVTEYQDNYVGGMRAQGIDIKELDDRVAPNLHDVGRLMQLSRAEKLKLKESGQSEYRYLRDRWKNDVLPLLDNERILKQTGVDLTDNKSATEFLDKTFDELVNKGKVTQEKTNIANRLAKPRVLHWKDATSLVEYNQKYGSGAIQDSIVRELSNGFSRLEFTKDWGVNPQQTLENTLKLADLDPDLKDRFYKSKEAKRFKSLIAALGGAPVERSLLGNIMQNFRAFENITKLGLVTLRSIPDLGLLATEASHAGMNGFEAIGDAVKTVFFNLHPEERELFRDLLDTSYTHEIGSILKYDLDEPSASKVAQVALRASNKLNFLEAWDSRLRSQTLAVWARRFAQSKNKDWEALGDNDKEIFSLYDINEPEWDLIRKSNIKVANHKEFITPDSIAQMSDEEVANVMRKHGGETPSKRSINDFREETAKRVLEYLEDRQAHVILRPGVLDKDALTFGHGVPEGGGVMGELFKLFTQFKMYSVNYARVPLASVLYGKGATDFREATIGGKGDLRGMAKLTAYMMAMKYASMSATNLVQGLSPPSLSKTDTWLKMLTEGAGVYGLAADLDLSDIPGSLGKLALGPVGGDVARVGRLAKSVRDDVFTNPDFSKTSKSAYALIKSAVPKYPLSAYVMNNLMMSEFEDMISPGTRERYLQNIDQQQGVTPLF